MAEGLSRRSYSWRTEATYWREIWEAGPYYEQVSAALENARRFAVIAGWQIDSRLTLRRPGAPTAQTTAQNGTETLRTKLIRLCEKNPELEIYLLIWDHAYFYMAERELWQGRIWENIHPRVHFVFDNRHPFGASHHEKICIIDGEVAFCGGIDLCDERWDTPQHLYEDVRRSLDQCAERHGPYHDLAVEVRGPVCDALLIQLGERWRRVCNIPFPSPPAQSLHSIRGPGPSPSAHTGHRVYISRTQVEIEAGKRSGKIRREVEFLFRDLIGSAQKRIILEGQYYWSLLIHDALRAKIAAMRGHRDFEIILLVAELESVSSPTRRMARFEARLLRDLEIAASLSGVQMRVLAPRVFQKGRRPRPVYVHSKVLLIDDRFVSVGSTNLASRALRLDTETHLTWEAKTLEERSRIERLAKETISHWNHANACTGSILGAEGSSLARTVSFMPGLRPAVRTGNAGPRWEILFDPDAPLFYSLKRKLRRFPKMTLGSIWALSVLFPALWIKSFLPQLSFELMGKPMGTPAFVGLALILGSVWWLRIPYFALLCGVCWVFGSDTSLALMWLSLWSASIWGYATSRISPETAWSKLGLRLSPNALHLAGSRSFNRVLRLTLDPRISVRTKIASHGLYHLPLPWFLWTLGIVLPMWMALGLWLVTQIFALYNPSQR